MSVNTFAIARSLRAAELPQSQAEAIAEAIGTAILDTAASKTDLAQAEAKLEPKIERLRSQMMTWFIATNLTIAAVVIAVVKP